MDQNKLTLVSISQDLKRVALSLHRGSNTTANRFAFEALNSRTVIDGSTLPPYINNLLSNLESATKDADLALMHSTLYQNYFNQA